MGVFRAASSGLWQTRLAAAALALPDVDLLHPQVVRHVAVATCTREYVELHLGDLAHRHRQNVPAQGRLSRCRLASRTSRIPTKTRGSAGQPEVVLEVVDGGDIGVLRETPTSATGNPSR